MAWLHSDYLRLDYPPPNPPTNIDLEIAAANEVMQTEAERSSFRTLF